MPYKPTGGPPGRPKKDKAGTPGEMPELTAQQWAALAIEERRFNPDCFEVSPKHFRAPAQSVANAVGVTRQSVYMWRRDHRYQRGLLWLWSRKLTERLERGDKEAAHEPPRQVRVAHLHAHASDWTEPVTSPLDGKVYETEEEYRDHLMAYDANKPIMPWVGPV
jgi:hypothetical protein